MPKYVQTNISVSPKQHEEWARLAQRENLSMSEVIRRALDEYLKSHAIPFQIKKIELQNSSQRNTIGQYIHFHDRNLHTER